MNYQLIFFIIADFTISHLATLSLHVQNLPVPVSRRFSLAVAVSIASTHCADSWMDGQAELTWMVD